MKDNVSYVILGAGIVNRSGVYQYRKGLEIKAIAGQNQSKV